MTTLYTLIGNVFVENRPPLNEETWTYIGNNEPIVFTKNNLPLSWYEKLHDKENYYTVVAQLEPSNLDGIPFVEKEPVVFSEEEVYEAIGKARGYRDGFDIDSSEEEIVASLRPKLKQIIPEMEDDIENITAANCLEPPTKPATYEKDGKTYLKVRQFIYE